MNKPSIPLPTWRDNVDPLAPVMYVLAQPSVVEPGRTEVIDEEGALTYYAVRPAHFVEKMVDAKVAGTFR